MNDRSPAVPASPRPGSAAVARRLGLRLIALAVLLGGVAWGAWHWFESRHVQTTDNAYVAGNVVQITPQLAGTVVLIQADETDFVKAGQVLVRLDSADAQVALEQAQAQLGQTVREVRSLFANLATFKAMVAQREAEQARAQGELSRAQDDVSRRRPLVASGAVGQEEMQHALSEAQAADSRLQAARAALAAAREQLAVSLTQTEGLRPDQHPLVLRAAARLREAWVAHQRSVLRSPIDGTVAKRSVQIGQRVQAGAPLMTVVALNQLWVDANFKEGQLQDLRIGQPATLQADVYGSKVSYRGTVAGLGAGTGAAFALLPAQNATGNWIKVVQRVPVRIVLDGKALAEHPLRVGLSMEVSVDVRNKEGVRLSSAPRQAPLAATEVFESRQDEADADIRRIIALNLGQPPVRR